MVRTAGEEEIDAWRCRILEVLRSDAGRKDSPGRTAAPAPPRLEVLAFGLGRETFGVEISKVAEIILPRVVARLPRTPSFIRGVVSLRGAVLPVVDLATRLGLPPGEPSRSSRIVVLRDGEERMGFWVERVNGVIRFAPGDVATTDFASVVDHRFLRGIGYDRQENLVALLCSEKLCDFCLDETA